MSKELEQATYMQSQLNKVEVAQHPDKGEFTGACNRTACNNTNAMWYNKSTRKYYCTPCAQAINGANPEAHKMYGTSLCVRIQTEQERPELQ